MSNILFDKFGKTFLENQIIFCEHEPGDDFYLIQSGNVKLTRVVDDQERILDILAEGDTFGEMSILEEAPRSATAIAYLGELKVLNFNKQNFDGLLKAKPAIGVKLLKIFSKRIYEAKRRLEILGFEDPETRIADTILMLAEQKGVPVGEDDNSVEIDTDMKQISNWCAIKVSEGSNILKRYQNVGKITIKPGKIVVNSLIELGRFVYNKRKIQTEGEM